LSPAGAPGRRAHDCWMFGSRNDIRALAPSLFAAHRGLNRRRLCAFNTLAIAGTRYPKAPVRPYRAPSAHRSGRPAEREEHDRGGGPNGQRARSQARHLPRLLAHLSNAPGRASNVVAVPKSGTSIPSADVKRPPWVPERPLIRHLAIPLRPGELAPEVGLTMESRFAPRRFPPISAPSFLP
jgi:hypothetical protein